MSGVYIVLVVNNKAEVEACEAYAGVQTALGRAWHLAVAKSGQNPIYANPSPPEEKLEDGSVRWIFLHTERYEVVVVFRNIETVLISKKDPMEVRQSWAVPVPSQVFIGDGYASSMPPLRIAVVSPSSICLEKDDPSRRDLPGGWDYSGKPITVGFLLDNSADVKLTADLSEVQRWALTIARVNKRPNFITGVDAKRIWINGLAQVVGGVFDQFFALEELKNRTPNGQAIVEQECAYLDALCDEEPEDLDYP